MKNPGFTGALFMMSETIGNAGGRLPRKTVVGKIGMSVKILLIILGSLVDYERHTTYNSFSYIQLSAGENPANFSNSEV